MTAAERAPVADERIRSIIEDDREAIKQARLERERQRQRQERAAKALQQALEDLRATLRRLADK